MKKLLIILTTIILGASATIPLIPYAIGSVDGAGFLESLDDYDWAKNEFGDRMDYRNQEFKTNDIIHDTGKNIEPDNFGNFIDYSKFSTSYQWEKSILKQAVTGVPTSKIFMPRGNSVADFGVTSKAQNMIELILLLIEVLRLIWMQNIIALHKNW
ncbi:hypothetical protein [[Acholeplasma] multilocale]|uniref:hypothetical protein n=1 Tax=[Acholeplasma] multilocale TaxID=264638 RepID=UPI000479DB11|nr:hypothetical protein [[Acholeplasma] multilocale]